MTVSWIAETLWDLLHPSKRRPPARRPPAPPRRPAAGRAAAARPVRPMQAKYDALVLDMKARHRIRVRKWRSSTSGCAWEVHYADGTHARLIESPYPRGPMSCAVFLHEVGHHAIGFGRYRPRCLEEFEAWRWSLTAMRDHGLNVTPAVERRVHDAIRYAVAKARRRGLRRVPVRVAAFLADGTMPAWGEPEASVSPPHPPTPASP